jgi:hypothetical protein
MGRPIVVTDSRQVRGPDGKGMDEAALLRLFDRYGISDRAARRQHVAIIARAFDQAACP